MENKKEMTTPNVSAATDTEQPFPKCTEHSIADCDENIKSFEEMQRESCPLSLNAQRLK